MLADASMEELGLGFFQFQTQKTDEKKTDMHGAEGRRNATRDGGFAAMVGEGGATQMGHEQLPPTTMAKCGPWWCQRYSLRWFPTGEEAAAVVPLRACAGSDERREREDI
ncbi:hypothetical protein PIB30_102754 [Stylosanthes scabra]|uniref:Uncharacterized protein n=1 Tax=Stylosanthes scabra TaxID=79078 RepID=A0ABU6VZK7_9FABA|nr:hypothetical protein [Stylosanthes scabra]